MNLWRWLGGLFAHPGLGWTAAVAALIALPLAVRHPFGPWTWLAAPAVLLFACICLGMARRAKTSKKTARILLFILLAAAIAALTWVWLAQALALGLTIGLGVLLLFVLGLGVPSSVRLWVQLGLAFLVVVADLLFPLWLMFPGALVVQWAALAVLTLYLIVLLGWLTTGMPNGVFVGTTNTWSLSVTQAVLWTAIVVPALVVLWLARWRGDHSNPLEILYDANLLILLGLPVATGGVAAGIVAAKLNAGPLPQARQDLQNVQFVRGYAEDLWKDYQSRNPSAPKEPPQGLRNALDRVPVTVPKSRAVPASTVHVAPSSLDDVKKAVPTLPAGDQTAVAGFLRYAEGYVGQARQGVVMTNLLPAEAKAMDMLTGDESGNAHATNFGKVQFFLLSLVTMAAYCAALGSKFATLPNPCDDSCQSDLPGLQGAFAGLLLTSAAGYLGIKSIPSS